MRVLVTGGAGFIGRAVATDAVRQGDDVLVVDSQDPANTLPGATYKQLCLPCVELGTLIEEFRPEVCVHCAGRASVAASVEDPATDFAHGVDGTFAVLDAIRRTAQTCKVVFLSSAAVYGNPHTLPVPESAPIAPLSPYGYHKAVAELLCREHATVYGIPTLSLRIFSAYGVGLQRQVLWDTSRKLLNSDVVELFGTGEETRDFIHVTDVARAVWHLVKHGTFDGGAYNLASGEAVSIASLARALACQLHPTASVMFTGVRPSGDPAQWQADVQKLRATGFHWSVDWEAGLREYATWVRGGCL